MGAIVGSTSSICLRFEVDLEERSVDTRKIEEEGMSTQKRMGRMSTVIPTYGILPCRHVSCRHVSCRHEQCRHLRNPMPERERERKEFRFVLLIKASHVDMVFVDMSNVDM